MDHAVFMNKKTGELRVFNISITHDAGRWTSPVLTELCIPGWECLGDL